MPPSKSTTKTTVEAQPLDPFLLEQNELATEFQSFLDPYRRSLIASFFPEVTGQLNARSGNNGELDTSEANFDAAKYLADNPDVANHKFFSKNPYEHWLRHGQEEGHRKFPAKVEPAINTSIGPEGEGGDGSSGSSGEAGVRGLTFPNKEMAEAFRALNELTKEGAYDKLIDVEGLNKSYNRAFENIVMPKVINTLNASGALRGGAAGEVAGKAGEEFALRSVGESRAMTLRSLEESRASEKDFIEKLLSLEAFKAAGLNNQPFPSFTPLTSNATRQTTSGGGDPGSLVASLLLPVVSAAADSFFGPKPVQQQTTNPATAPGSTWADTQTGGFSISPNWSLMRGFFGGGQG